eukprot:SAG11_NODE_965_length_6360_cov_11.622584_5_plen_60_part_00
MVLSRQCLTHADYNFGACNCEHYVCAQAMVELRFVASQRGDGGTQRAGLPCPSQNHTDT